MNITRTRPTYVQIAKITEWLNAHAATLDTMTQVALTEKISADLGFVVAKNTLVMLGDANGYHVGRERKSPAKKELALDQHQKDIFIIAQVLQVLLKNLEGQESAHLDEIIKRLKATK